MARIQVEINGRNLGIAGSVIVGIILATVFCTTWYNRVNVDIKAIQAIPASINKTITETSDESQEKIVKAIKDAGEGIEESIGELAGSVDGLASAITARELTPIAIKSARPSALTEFGERISMEIDGKNLAKSLASELAPQVEGLMPRDIQDFSFKYVYDFAFEDIGFRNQVRKIASENSVSELVVVNVLGIELRDALLEINFEG